MVPGDGSSLADSFERVGMVCVCVCVSIQRSERANALTTNPRAASDKSHAGTRLALLRALRMGADSISLCVAPLRPSVTRKTETKLRLVRWDAFL
jgi:hypothetical protein